MGARVAVPEKDSVKGVISPDTDLKKPQDCPQTRAFLRIETVGKR